MANLHVLTCEGCSYDILLQPSFLEAIKNPPPREVEILNFVCPWCGHGYRYEPSKVPTQDFLGSHIPPDPYHEAIKCVEAGCKTYAKVYTLADSGTDSAKPAKPFSEWKLHGITCSDGHPAKEPVEIFYSRLSRR